MTQSSSTSLRRSKYTLSEEQWIADLDINFSLLDLLLTEHKDTSGPELLKNRKYDSLLKPFNLRWVFGFSQRIAIINLASGDRREIFYTAANVGIFYNYCTKKMRFLNGHQQRIISASADRSGKWLATAEHDNENIIMIWDTLSCKLLLTIFNHPPSPGKLVKIAMSPSAKLLVTVTDYGDGTIDFWLWTHGRETPDDSYAFEDSPGNPKAIEFHPDKEEYFMVIYEKRVLLFAWDYETAKICKPTVPKVTVSGIGINTDGTYVEGCHECFVSTSKGYILVFGSTIYAKPFAEDEVNNKNKIYIKCIKVSRDSITCLNSIDGIIVTGDTNGTIRFFDKYLKLLYWFSKYIVKPISCISFKLEPRKYVFETIKVNKDIEEPIMVIAGCEDRSEEYEILIKDQIPRDASLGRRPFLTRDFFLATVDGTMYVCNFPKKQFTQIFSQVDSFVAAIDVHDELSYLLVAYTKGRVSIVDYETHEEVVSTVLPPGEPNEDGELPTISAVKFSRQCLHLACGKSNGELLMLHPALLTQIYVAPFKYGPDRIMKIIFSDDSLQMVYYDSNMTVYAFVYDANMEDWIFRGKVRSHYKEICNIMFFNEEPYKLYSLGKDRYLISYIDLITNSNEELDVETRERIDQKDIPVYFTTYPRRQFSKCGYFLLADNRHKFKVVSILTNMCTAVYLGPSYGCFAEEPVIKMEYIPKHSQKYLVFMTKRHIGIQMLPIDGNPYKIVGRLGHPEELLDFKISKNGRHLFTIGKNDRNVFMWKIKVIGVETMYQLGGEEMQPFYCLLEGGKNGFLFQEMQDLFYYMQILQQGEQVSLPRIVTDYINIGELPDLVRACGYYPSEYEIENLLTDIRYKDFDDTGVLKDRVTFCEFVKLYINHKPAHGYSIDQLEEAFDTVCTFNEDYMPGEIEREDFIEALTATGEAVNKEQIYKCLVTLLHFDMEDTHGGQRDFGFLPQTLYFDTFTDDILGIDMNATRENTTTAEEEEDASMSWSR